MNLRALSYLLLAGVIVVWVGIVAGTVNNGVSQLLTGVSAELNKATRTR